MDDDNENEDGFHINDDLDIDEVEPLTEDFGLDEEDPDKDH